MYRSVRAASKIVMAAFVGSYVVCSISASAQSVQMKLKYRAGETYGYQTSGVITIPIPGAGEKGGAPGMMKDGLKIPVNTSQQIRVLLVHPDGSADLEVATKGSVNLPGVPSAPSGAVTKTKVTAAASGALSMDKKVPGGATAAIGAVSGVGSTGAIAMYLPSKPVKIGDSWSEKVAVPQLGGFATVTAKYVANGNVGHFKTAHIKLSVVIPLALLLDNTGSVTRDKTKAKSDVAGKVSMTYDQDFAVQEGRLIRSVGSGATVLKIRSVKQGEALQAKDGKVSAITTKIDVSSALTQ